MKKKLLSMSLALMLSASFNISNAQAVEEGNILIDVYSGGPNLYTSVIKAAYVNAGSQEDISISGLPAIGGRVGYMVSDKISIGADVNFTSTTVKYSEFSGSDSYDYTIAVPRLRAMVRFEFHFGTSDKFDFYWPVAAGYNSTKFNFTTNDPDYIGQSITNLIPVAFRSGIGGRYYFTDNFGLNLELGLGGGPLIEGGLALKF